MIPNTEHTRTIQLAKGRRGDLVAFAKAPDHWHGDRKCLWLVRNLPMDAKEGDWVVVKPDDPDQGAYSGVVKSTYQGSGQAPEPIVRPMRRRRRNR